MKVLQVNKYNYIRGGAESVFFNTTRLLEAHGHTVVKFCIDHPKNEPSPDEKYFAHYPEVRDLGWWGKARSVVRFVHNSDAATRLDELLTRERPDVAHLHNIFNSMSPAILPVLKRHNVPVVITVHDTRFICPTTSFKDGTSRCDNCLKWGGLSCGLHRCYERNFFYSWMCAMEMLNKEKLVDYNKYIDRYIFVSKRYRALYEKRHRYFADKGTVLYNFMPGLRELQPATQRGDYLLYYGRISQEKGIETLVEAMSRLPQYTLKVAGHGPLLDSLKARGVDNVEFLGYKSGQELWDVVRGASFVVVPSQWEENNPLTIIESYSYGKPVLGSRMGGIPEIVDEGNTGFTFDAMDVDSLVQAIDKAMKVTPEQYTRLSLNARRWAEDNFEAEGHYERLIDIYQSIINFNNK